MFRIRLIKVVPVAAVVALGLSLAPLAVQASSASSSARAAAALPAVAPCVATKAVATVKPGTLAYACADVAGLINNISWSKWTSTSALGIGRLTYNTCSPACVDGNDLLYTVNITLSKPETLHGKVIFQSIKMAPVAGKNPTLTSSSPGGGWGVIPQS